jgi:predicted TIM-barrel fold metal-dependent hydrolase
MIDMHIHVVPPNLPGVGPLGAVLQVPPEVVGESLRQEMRDAGVHTALAMGCLDSGPGDPLGIGKTLEVCRRVPGVFAIGAADPRRNEPEHLRAVAEVLAAGQVRALKGYLGYLHYAPDHAGYRPYYELAERHRVPFIFHTGDTYSPRAKLRFAHPLGVDDVAVDHPRVNFVMAHVGNPWLIEAAEVVYKNINVWVDISGLAIGDADAFSSPERQEALRETIDGVRRAFCYAERPNRFLYGSDWPLAPMAVYRKWVAAAIPEVHHPQVFEDNARVLFRL